MIALSGFTQVPIPVTTGRVQVDRYYSPGLLSAEVAVLCVRVTGLTEGDGHLTIMVCDNSEQRGGRRCHRR